MRSMHLDDEKLQRLIHGELASLDIAPVRDHLAGCAECRTRLDAARRDEAEVHALLRHLDHPPPPVAVLSNRGRARTRNRGWLKRAAAVVLAFGLGGVAWAAPGSPLPVMLANVIDRIDRSDVAADASLDAPATPEISGIAVAPAARLMILFTSAQAAGEARVALTDDAEVTVRAPVGAAAFNSSDGRLVIENAGSVATFDIGIPRTAARVEIRVDGERLFLKDGARVIDTNALPSGGVYVLPLRKPGSN